MSAPILGALGLTRTDLLIATAKRGVVQPLVTRYHQKLLRTAPPPSTRTVVPWTSSGPTVPPSLRPESRVPKAPAATPAPSSSSSAPSSAASPTVVETAPPPSYGSEPSYSPTYGSGGGGQQEYTYGSGGGGSNEGQAIPMTPEQAAVAENGHTKLLLVGLLAVGAFVAWKKFAR